MINQVERWINEFAHGNLVVSSYWLDETQDNLLNYMGEEEKKLPKHIQQKIECRTDDFYRTRSEVEALEQVISDMEAKLERGIKASLAFLDAFDIKFNTKETE
ncbi:MAG TPA: hypothetical protein ENO02_10210 [Epsilonproteobacteria bacterium]|nr:hypothetical protein [Campylobacterota bacterium]